VFLADPAGEWDHGVGLHIDRQGTTIRGYMAAYGQARGRGKPPLLASPAGWDEMASKEQAFQDAEKQRLLYVAATRAGAQLVISQRGKGNEWNPWSFFEPLLESYPDLQEPGEQKAPPAKPESISDKQVSSAVAAISNRWGLVANPTYALVSAKAISVKAGPRSATAGEHGTEWGSVIHLLLQAAITDPKADLQGLAASALADEGLDPALAGQAIQLVERVTTSSLWKRAAAGSCRLAEVPFQRLLPAGDGQLPSILRGVIDLVFLEAGGWVIVDYKTDDDPDQPADGLVKHYGPQVRLYAVAWQAITGQPVHETGFFLVRSGRFVAC
jgi:ATP-dependent helicase/nuclease subunit A